MEKKLTFNRENQNRIKAVSDAFGPPYKSLVKTGRILLGEGRLQKQCRKKTKTKAFFLFNDVLVYGTIVINGRMYKKQKLIPLENIKLEDMVDTDGEKNQWMIRTPKKSFRVVAPTQEEKRLWMSLISEYKATLLQQGHTATNEFAVSWMPDSASDICLVCEAKFTAIYRRHHCRNCGILVCSKCCKEKTLIGHMSATKKQKVCRHCYGKKQDEVPRHRGNSAEDDLAESSDDDEEEQDNTLLYQTPSSWLDTRMGTWTGIGAYMTMHPVKG